jgi:hypothetical protein
VLVEQPGERTLAGGNREAGREPPHRGVPVVVDGEDLSLEPGRVVPKVCVPEVGDGAGEEAPTERAPRHDPHAELIRGGEQVGQDRLPRRPLDLHGGDRLDGVGPAELVGGDVPQAELSDQPLAYQIRDGASSVFYGHVRVGEVQVVEVDHVVPSRRRLSSS